MTLDPCGKQDRISGHNIVYYPAIERRIRDEKTPKNKTKTRVRPGKVLI